MAYAVETEVPVDRTRGDIEKTLTRYGADAMLMGHADNVAFVQFRAEGRVVKFVIPLPARDAYSTEAKHHQATRSRWRATLLVIKAKLESIESKIETFDEAFLPHIVLPDGQTVGAWLNPQVALAFQHGAMPKMLPDYSGGRR